MSIDYLLPPVRNQSTFMLPHADDSSHRIDNMLFAGHKLRLQRRARGHRRERRGDAQYRTVEIIESFLLNARDDFGADAALLDSFVHDDQPAGFFYRVDN